MNDPFRNFDRDFARAERSIDRKASLMFGVVVVWLTFLMGAIGTGIWLVGRYLGAW